MRVEIREHGFSPWEEVARYEEGAEGLARGRYGGCAVFVGSMRDFNLGDEVREMVLEHYAGMTERELERLAGEALGREGVVDGLVVHRVGRVVPGEAIVVVAAWAGHRAEAFAACREMMEALKQRAPFWKKERLVGGERWVEGNTQGEGD